MTNETKKLKWRAGDQANTHGKHVDAQQGSFHLGVKINSLIIGLEEEKRRGSDEDE